LLFNIIQCTIAMRQAETMQYFLLNGNARSSRLRMQLLIPLRGVAFPALSAANYPIPHYLLRDYGRTRKIKPLGQRRRTARTFAAVSATFALLFPPLRIAESRCRRISCSLCRSASQALLIQCMWAFTGLLPLHLRVPRHLKVSCALYECSPPLAMKRRHVVRGSRQKRPSPVLFVILASDSSS